MRISAILLENLYTTGVVVNIVGLSAKNSRDFLKAKQQDNLKSLEESSLYNLCPHEVKILEKSSNLDVAIKGAYINLSKNIFTSIFWPITIPALFI